MDIYGFESHSKMKFSISWLKASSIQEPRKHLSQMVPRDKDDWTLMQQTAAAA